MEYDEQYPKDKRLDRFVSAQNGIYDEVLAELSAGQKQSHWMWFIFPQLQELGRSETARFYAIRDLDEARAYLHHPVLGSRLLECTRLVMKIRHRSMSEVFGYPDDMKLKSSLTLFPHVAGEDSIFKAALDAHFGGEQDAKTLRLLGKETR